MPLKSRPEKKSMTPSHLRGRTVRSTAAPGCTFLAQTPYTGPFLRPKHNNTILTKVPTRDGTFLAQTLLGATKSVSQQLSCALH